MVSNIFAEKGTGGLRGLVKSTALAVLVVCGSSNSMADNNVLDVLRQTSNGATGPTLLEPTQHGGRVGYVPLPDGNKASPKPKTSM